MLKHTKGNLIDLAEAGEFDVIVHGCNCQNVMGSGIAKEIRERYPSAFEADELYHRQILSQMDGNVAHKLGHYSVAYEPFADKEGHFAIINAYTQFDYWPRGVDHFNYDSFKLILWKMLVTYHGLRFGFPYIGMGLAGGDKDRIIPMMEQFALDIEKTGGSATLVEFA